MSIVIAMVCTSTKVYASESPAESVQTQTKLYYFTDNPNYNYYLNGTIASNGFIGSDVEYYYYPIHGFYNVGEFEYEILDLFGSGYFWFDNSIVIFEMREGFLTECCDSGQVFAQYLEYIFYDLKERCNNNSIMFICDTDESL